LVRNGFDSEIASRLAAGVIDDAEDPPEPLTWDLR
jgi:hypothetical protein